MSSTPHEPTSPASHRSRGTWHPAWLLGCIWLLYCLWSFVTWSSWYETNAVVISPFRLAFLAIFDWAFWIVGAPAVWWLSKHFPPTNGKRFCLVHLPVSLLCAIAALTLSAAVRSAFEPISPSVATQLESRLGPELGWYLVFYWLVVCSYLALEYHAAYQSKLAEGYALELRNVQLGRDLAESRLANLRHQLHPHFLFNSLHAVSALMDFSVDTARDKLVMLSELLRMSLDISRRDVHAVADEIGWLERYLALESMRHAPGVSWQLGCDEAVQHMSVPCLITQPLVENAIKHGKRAGSMDAIQLCVHFAMKGRSLVISVDDNGPGWSAASGADGMGLTYVRRVLSSLTWGEAQLEFSRSEMGGASAQIRIAHLADQSGAT